MPARIVALSGVDSPELDLSSTTGKAGPFSIAYEGFHWPGIPRPQDVACSVITALGDHYDFIASYSDFRVDNPEGDTIELGPVHWGTGVHLPAAFPYGRSYEADAMGGSTWKDNGDGTSTQLDRDYYSPAKGYSWLGLYLMGLAKPEEVKPFFVLRNLHRTGKRDADGHPIYTGDKTVITIQDVIAAMGPRVPDFAYAQKEVNTAIVVMTLPGKQPTPELLAHANDIAEHWIAYWSKTTGGRSVMTVKAR